MEGRGKNEVGRESWRWEKGRGISPKRKERRGEIEEGKEEKRRSS